MEEINFIRPEEIYNRNTGESKVRYRSYDGNDRFIPVVEGEDGVPKTLTEVTWQELKDKRDGGKLTAGALYRITDYQCTTTQENTQSAGHQFDIVLLALSENKLAEEGWAMMHDNIYDVTFADGVTKKCYWYFTGNDGTDNIGNLVDIETLLGASEVAVSELTIDEENKTIDTNSNYGVGDLSEPNLPYNYFQNSKLEAWKVWYCLDNDTARFAWADDSVDEGTPASIEVNGGDVFERSEVDDASGGEFRYAWKLADNVLYTQNTTPSQGDSVYFDPSGIGKTDEIEAYNPPHEGTGLPNGRGVIYRLIDEFNNDVAYDFKNIQFSRKVNNANIPDSNGNHYSFLYTFSITNQDKANEILDASIFAKKFLNDEEGEGRCYSNFINRVDEYSVDISMRNIYTLSDIVFVSRVSNYDTSCLFVNIKCYNSRSLSIVGRISNVNFVRVINASSNDYFDLTCVTLSYIFDSAINAAMSNTGFITGGDGTLRKINLVTL